MRNDFGSGYLMHHGILGQKWGIRRYQNEDGSLTEAGKKRYGVGPGRGVEDISSSKGVNRRLKDVKKAIKKNEKARGKAHTKMANNPENFLGLNKKHAKKIEEHSENIRKGEEEVKSLKAKKDELDKREKGKKQLAKELKTTLKEMGNNVSAEEYENARNKILDKAITDEEKKTLRDKYEKFSKAFDAEDKFWYSKEASEASRKAYDETVDYFKKSNPEYLSSIIKDNNGKNTGLDAYHDFRKVFDGYQDEEWSKAQEKYDKKNGTDSSKSTEYYNDWYNYSKELADSLVGRYGNTKISDLGKSAKITVNSEIWEAITEDYSRPIKKK